MHFPIQPWQARKALEILERNDRYGLYSVYGLTIKLQRECNLPWDEAERLARTPPEYPRVRRDP